MSNSQRIQNYKEKTCFACRLMLISYLLNKFVLRLSIIFLSVKNNVFIHDTIAPSLFYGGKFTSTFSILQSCPTSNLMLITYLNLPDILFFKIGRIIFFVINHKKIHKCNFKVHRMVVDPTHGTQYHYWMTSITMYNHVPDMQYPLMKHLVAIGVIAVIACLHNSSYIIFLIAVVDIFR